MTAVPERQTALDVLAPSAITHPPSDETQRQQAERRGLLRPMSVTEGFQLSPDGWASKRHG